MICEQHFFEHIGCGYHILSSYVLGVIALISKTCRMQTNSFWFLGLDGIAQEACNTFQGSLHIDWVACDGL